jgi:hypothetical protein
MGRPQIQLEKQAKQNVLSFITEISDKKTSVNLGLQHLHYDRTQFLELENDTETWIPKLATYLQLEFIAHAS